MNNHLGSPARRAAWLNADRFLGEMGIQQDGAAGQLQFKLMAEQRRGQEEPQAWRSVRRGWCMGDEQFRNELPEQMRPGMGRHHCGQERWETAEAHAEQIVAEHLQRRGWGESNLERRRKGDAGKQRLAP